MHSVPSAPLGYKFILMLVECINFEVTNQALLETSSHACCAIGKLQDCPRPIGK